MDFSILVIASFIAMACAIPGVFLVLRGMSLMSDAISHASLLGLVLTFFVVKTFSSPWLIVGATLAGVLTVTITEMLIRTDRLKEDAAIGLVFPVFFSLGVILITKFAGNVHIDSDCVLFGEIAFTPFNRLLLWGHDVGPVAMWSMGGILSLNLVYLLLFYKELKIVTFDKGLAHSLGYSPFFIHYSLMTLTSVTAVGSFESVGSILVVALMITPPATAFLITDKLSSMIVLSLMFGLFSAFSGYGMAYLLDVSISGSMATMSGVVFILVLFFFPKKGLLPTLLASKNRSVLFSARMLLVQLLDHEGKDNEQIENTVSNMVNHMGWTEIFAKKVARRAVQERYITRRKDLLRLTDYGRELAKQVMVSG